MPSLKSLLVILPALAGASAFAAELTFTGANLPAITETPAPSTGLTAVYVLPYVEGVSAQFTSESGETVTWERFSAMGAAYAEPVESSRSGNVSTLNKLEGNMGYKVSEGNKSTYFWVVDYSSAPFGVRDIMVSPQSDCSSVWLEIEGEGPQFTFYGITGVPQHLNRGITLSYRTLEFDSESFSYSEVEHTEALAELKETVICNAPLCPTEFTIIGDKYAAQWGDTRSAASAVYTPVAVAAETRAAQSTRDNDNEIKEETALGGSGPVEVEFSAAVTDAVVYHEWELARDSEFNQVFLRRQDLDFSYTFREQGTVYVRLMVANDAGTCEAEGETYEVFVGESVLKCPNAFSPGVSEGVNDEWKVAYKSIVEFDCRIFDRNGRRLAHLTDPSQGWNGKINGKTAPPGVYFYVIKALGADGRKYKLSGDINIIGYRKGAPVTPID